MNSGRVPVLFLVNSLYIGGAERHVVTLLNNLDTAEFDLSLTYLKRDEGLLPQVKQDRLRQVLCCEVDRKIDQRAISRIARQIDEQEIQVIVCTNNYSLLYGWLARRRSRHQPRIIQVYHTTNLSTWKEKLQSAFYKPLVRQCDLLIYVCNNQRRFWDQRGLKARNELVIHNGIDTSHYSDRYDDATKEALRAKHGFSNSDYVIGVCAVLRPEKAHTDVMLAVQRLRASGTPAKALFIGDGPERSKLEIRRSELGLESDVAITGFQSDVRPLVSACDVMTLASHAIETFSLSALESMSMGKPLVLTRIGGADEQVQPGVNGFLYTPGDIEALSGHLATLFDVQMRKAMGAAAARIVQEKFTVSGMTDAYAKVLKRIAAGDPLPA